jgi:hypothetical protein
MLKEDFLRFLERAIELGFSRERLKAMVIDFFKEEI